ncbi:hypothetical protein QBC39DRAFT_267529 [Podospora conica]|nr:hypothetical protein QBC39DRAFT_267529 [Schizothecium conicum]
MESVYCNCKQCSATIGLFVNLWTQIGKSYFSPVIAPDDSPAVLREGASRMGEKGTLVEECHLQDIACASCNVILGLQCLETPVNHVLDEDQLLLRLASVELLTKDGQEAEFNAKRVLDVREPSKVSASNFPGASPSSAFGASSFHEIQDLVQIQNDLKAQREDIKRIDSNGFKIVSALDTRVVRIEEQVTKLKDSLGSFRSDIAGTQEDLASLKAEVGEVKRAAQNKGPVAGLEKRLKSTDAALQDIRQDVGALEEKFGELSGVNLELQRQKKEIDALKSDIRSRTLARDHAKDMAALRTEMLQMRRQMDEMRSKTVERVAAPFPAKELDILASNIAKVGARANQVETLQMEFEILKGRIERSEASRQASDDRVAGHTTEARNLPPYTDSPLARRKRASSIGDTITAVDPLFKRQAFSSGFNASQVYDVPSEWAEESAAGQEKHGENEVTPAHKLTKSGNVDKRTQRPRRSLNGKIK